MALAHYQGYVENVSTGKALPDAVIRVYSYPANILQSTFADLASTPKPVVSTDETGAFSFYIADGAYDIEYVYNGDVLSRLRNIPIYNPANVLSYAAPAQNIEFTATASQTVFNFPSPAMPTFVSVFLNGVRLPSTDFSHVGTTVTFNVGAAAGDTVTLSGFLQAGVPDLTALGVLAEPGGAALVGFLQSGTGSVARTAQAKAREIISFADKAAPVDGSNGTTQINNAIATGRHVETGSANYYAQGITIGSDGQVIASRGASNILRNANGAIINTAANDITIEGVSFYGEDPSFTGDVLNFTGARTKLLFAASRDAGASKVVNITGDSALILGCNDVYDGKVTITSPGGGAPASLYHNVIAARFNGLVDFTNTGFVSASGCLFGDGLTVAAGAATFGNHGSRLLSSRVVGTLTVTQSSTSIGSGMSVSGSVVIGDGSTSFTGITVDPSFLQSSGTFQILAGVKGTFHIGALYEAGVAITIPDSVRAASLVYHGRINFTPTISGDGGSYVAGASILSAKYSQQGNHIEGYVVLSLGAGVTLPTGGLYCTVPVATSDPIMGQVTVSKSGVGDYGGNIRIFSSNRMVGWFPKDAAIDGQLTVSSPAALAANDTVQWVFSYTLAGL